MEDKLNEAIKCAECVLCNARPSSDDSTEEHVSNTETIVTAFDAAVDLYQQSLNPDVRLKDDLKHPLGLPFGMRESAPSSRRVSSSVLSLEKQLSRRDSMLSVAYANLASFKEAPPISLALELFEKVVEHIHKTSDEPYPDLISAYNNMASIARVKGHENIVVELYLKAIGIANEYDQIDPMQLASVFLNLADFLEEKGEYLEAEEFLRKVVLLYEENNQEHSFSMVNALLRLGKICEIQNKYRSARESYEQVLTILRMLPGDHDLSLASAYSLLANTTEILGDAKLAFYYHKQALYLWKAHHNQDWSLQIVLEYNSMANILQTDGNYPDALELYMEALQISENTTGPFSPLTACLCQSIGEVHRKSGVLDLAIEYFDKTLEIKETMFRNKSFEKGSQ